MSVLGMGWNSRATVEKAVAFAKTVVQDGNTSKMTHLAVPAFKYESTLPVAVASELGLQLVWVSQQDMLDVQVKCQTFSQKTYSETGMASVAEACALAAAGRGAVLLVPRRAADHVTCALAAALAEGGSQ